MLKLIIGLKGSGKTKQLIELANKAVEVSPGHVVTCHFPEAKLDANGDYLFKINQSSDAQ